MASASQSFQVIVDPPVTPLSLAAVPTLHMQVGIPFSYTFVANGGTPPYTYSLVTPIPGLSLDPATGDLTGTPTTAGTFSDTATVTDSAP